MGLSGQMDKRLLVHIINFQLYYDLSYVTGIFHYRRIYIKAVCEKCQAHLKSTLIGLLTNHKNTLKSNKGASLDLKLDPRHGNSCAVNSFIALYLIYGMT